MSHPHDVTMTEWARAPPASGPVWQTIAKALYNPEDHSVFGRTAKRWGIVLTFYLVFYAALAAMFAACMGGLFYTLDDKRPTFVLHESLIGVNPGLAFRPRPTDGYEIRPGVGNSTEVYIEQLEDFLKPYERVIPPDMEKCTSADRFSYPRSPCLFIKLNKIFNWVPEYYEPSALPEDMPADLKEHIQALAPEMTKNIWLSCFEELQSNHTFGATFEYPWGRSLLGTYPFTNQKGHVGPFLPVVVTPPVNQEVNIRCRVWAKNIIYKKSIKEPSGHTRFRIYVAADEEAETTTSSSSPEIK